MRKWRDPHWYRYVWRHRLSLESRALLVLAAAGLALLAGFLAADRFASASTGTTDAYIVKRTTITKIVTIRKNGKTIVRRYPVVHTVRIKAQAVTIQALQTITTPGGTKVVPVTKVKYVPVTHTVDQVVTSFVTKNGKTTTLVETRPVTVQQTVATTVSQTQTQVVTNEHTTTNNITNEHTNTVVTTQPVTTVSTVIQTTTRTTTNLSTTTQVVVTTQILTTTNTKTITQSQTVTLPVVTITVPVTVTVTTTAAT